MINIVCCEECKYYEEYDSSTARYYRNADGECKRDLGGYPADVPMDYNDFCSRGERKENNG